jgi:hypothetical protein
MIKMALRLSMAFSQFDLARMLRCSEADDEGFSCMRRPSHGGEHRSDRCEMRDAGGHRCMLNLRHPGTHRLPWYDRPVAPGETHTIAYGGTEGETGAFADKAAEIAARYGWVRTSRTFRPGLFWRWPPSSGWLSGMTAPHGRLTVVFEFRPPEGTPT